MEEKELLKQMPGYKTLTCAKTEVFFEFDDENNLIVRIDYLKIPERSRYKGLGTKEVNNVLKWAKENGAKEVIVESSRPTILFWRRMGFDVLDQGSKYSTGIYELT